MDYCDEYVGITISNVYKYTAEKKVVSGDFLFYHIRMEEGKTYAISSLGFIGMFYLYNAQGEQLTLGAGDTYTCQSAGIYYLVIEVQMTVNAQVRFEVAHGQCQYNNKGQCEFEHAAFNLDANGNTVMETVSCGKTDPGRTRVYDNQVMSGTVVPGKKTFVYMNYAAKGVTYLIDLPTTVDYYLYDENGNLIVDGENGVTYTKATNEDGTRTQDTYVDVDSQRILYVVITTKADATESVVVSGKISHVHNINYRGVCTVKDTSQNTAMDCTVNLRTALTADSEITAIYAAGTMGYYELNLTAGTEYTMNLDSAYVVWTLMNAEGTVVANSEGGELFIPTEGGDYYLVVSGVSTLTEETEVTISVTSHVHVITNKGVCADENCDYELTDYRKDLDEMVGETEGQIVNGKHYYKATMEAGKTYKLSFTADGITYVLYGGENADVVMTVTDGAFVCTESGEYYYVITVAQNTAQQDKIIYTVEETTPVVEE